MSEESTVASVDASGVTDAYSMNVLDVMSEETRKVYLERAVISAALAYREAYDKSIRNGAMFDSKEAVAARGVARIQLLEICDRLAEATKEKLK